MINPEQFVARWHDTKLADLDEDQDHIWGVSPLVRYDARNVVKLPLSEADQRFLINAGLPTYAFNSWRFGYPSNSLPPITEAIDGWDYPTHYDRYRVLGCGIMEVNRTTFFEEIVLSVVCLDLKRHGQVVIVRSLPDYPVEVLNSSVAQFAELILLYRQLVEWNLAHKLKLDGNTDYDAWDQERDIYEHGIIEQMLLIDPQAGQLGTGWHGELTLTPHG